jgi:hypothetical protein
MVSYCKKKVGKKREDEEAKADKRKGVKIRNQ